MKLYFKILEEYSNNCAFLVSPVDYWEGSVWTLTKQYFKND